MNSNISNEEYFCVNCQISCRVDEVMKDWRCPICQSYIKIKINIKGNDYECLRVSPSELRPDNIVTLDNINIYSIIDVTRVDDIYKIALKGYRQIKAIKENRITMIDGSWFHSISGKN